jgi:DNA-binding NarL/FixJ family response regulator
VTHLTAKGAKSSSRGHKPEKELPPEGSLASGEKAMPNDLATKAFKSPSQLTARELEIIRFLALGKSSKQIAHLLVISCRTVDTHRANCMRKLNLHSVTELLHFVLTNKLLETDSARPNANSTLSPSYVL